MISSSESDYLRLVMSFEIIGPLVNVETIAVGKEIREVARLQKAYGKGRWRKRKGVGRIKLQNGSVHTAEIHWYEAHGIGAKEHKIKHILT
ncbi:MAG TPA: hypothetical protein VII30_03575 [Gemmatimonadaceae bacterium]